MFSVIFSSQEYNTQKIYNQVHETKLRDIDKTYTVCSTILYTGISLPVRAIAKVKWGKF